MKPSVCSSLVYQTGLFWFIAPPMTYYQKEILLASRHPEATFALLYKDAVVMKLSSSSCGCLAWGTEEINGLAGWQRSLNTYRGLCYTPVKNTEEERMELGLTQCAVLSYMLCPEKTHWWRRCFQSAVVITLHDPPPPHLSVVTFVLLKLKCSLTRDKINTKCFCDFPGELQ